MADVEKFSDTEIQIVETKQQIQRYTIADLKNDKAIYLAHVAEYQKKADDVDVLLAQAAALGVTEPQPVVEPVAEEII